MDDVYCTCGARLDENPALPADQRSPCPTCGSLARRFDATASVTAAAIILADGGTATDSLVVAKAGCGVEAHAGVATGTGAAYDAGVQIPQPEVTDGLVTMERFVRVEQLEKQPNVAWATQVYNERGELVDMGTAVDADDAILGIMEALRPPDPK